MFRKPKRKDAKSSEEVTVRSKGEATSAKKSDTLPKSGATGSFRAPSNRCTCCERPFGVLQSFRARHCEYCRGSVCGKCYNDRKCHRCFTRQRFDVRSVDEFRQLDRESLLRMLTALHVPRAKVEQHSRADIITEILTRCGLGEQLRLYRDSLKQEDQVEEPVKANSSITADEAGPVTTAATIKELSDKTASSIAIVDTKSDTHTTQAQVHINLKSLSSEAEVRQLSSDVLRSICDQGAGDAPSDPLELMEKAVLLWQKEHGSQVGATEATTPKTKSSTPSSDVVTTGGATSTPPAHTSSPPIDLTSITTEAEIKNLTTKELASILKAHGINQKMFSEKNEMLREVLQLWQEAQRTKQKTSTDKQAPAMTKQDTKESFDSLEFEEDLQKLGDAELKLYLFHHGLDPAAFPEKPQLLAEAIRLWRTTRVYENLPSKSKTQRNTGDTTPKSTTMNPIYEENESTQVDKNKSLSDGILQSEDDLRQLSVPQLRAILNSFDIKTEMHNNKEELVKAILLLLQSSNDSALVTTPQPPSTATSNNGLFLRDIKSEEFIQALNVAELKSLLLSCGVNGTDQFTERYELVNVALRLWREEMKSNQSKNRKSIPTTTTTKKDETDTRAATVPASRKGPTRPNESKIVEVTSWKDKHQAAALNKMVSDDLQPQIATPRMENLKFRADIEKLTEQQLRSILRRGNITTPPSTAKPELVEAVANLWLQQKHTAVSSSSSESITSSSSQLSSADDDSVVANATTTTASPSIQQTQSTPSAEEISKMNIKQLMTIVREHGLTPTKLLERKQLAEEVIVLLSRKKHSEMDKRSSSQKESQPPANLKPIASATVMATLEEIQSKEEISKMDAATLRSILALKGIVVDTEQHILLVSAVIKLWEAQKSKRDLDNSMPEKTTKVAGPPVPPPPQVQQPQKVMVTMSTMSRLSAGEARDLVVLSDITSEDEIRGLDLYNLKTILTQSRIRHEGFAERREYIDEVTKLWRLQHNDRVDSVVDGGSGQTLQKVTASISNLETPKTPAKELKLEEITSEDVIQTMHIFNLKSILQSNGQMPIGERQDLVNDVKNLWRKQQAALQMQRRELERQQAAKMAAAGIAPPPPSRPPAGVTRRSFLERIKASSRIPSATTPAATSLAGNDRELEDIRSETEVRELSYQNLKNILVKRNVSTRRLLRKQDLQREVLAVWRARPPPPVSPGSPGVPENDVLLLDEIRSESELDALSDVNLKIILKICEPGIRTSWAMGPNGEGHPATRAEVLQQVRQLWRKQAIIPTLDQLGSLEEIAALEAEQLRSILRKDLHECKEKAELVIRVQFLYSLNKRRAGQLSSAPVNQPEKELSERPQSTSFPPPPPPEVDVDPVLGIAAETEIPYLSIAQIKQILLENEVSVDGVVDKEELIERLKQLWRLKKANAAPPADTVMV